MKIFATRWVRALALAALVVATPASAEKKHGPGVTDTEIRIGQTMPYSGPVSPLGTHGRAMTAYFAKVNDEGGVNGRRIRLLSLDDGFSPPKTVEQTRKLVEEEQVLLMMGSLGTATNLAVQRYLNAKKVPQLFLVTGASRLSDPAAFPWTMGFVASYRSEAAIYARYLQASRSAAKIAVIYQNDDFGKDLLGGFRDALGTAAAPRIVAEISYELTDPVLDQQVISARSSGADTLLTFATPKAGAQILRKVHDLGWAPLHIVAVAASSLKGTLEPAGVERAVGLVSGRNLKEPGEPDWAADPGVRDYLAFMRRYYPDGDPNDPFNTLSYTLAQTMVHVLARCGDELTRENVLRQAQSLSNLELPLLLPGIRISTSPSDYRPFTQLQLARFDGKRWVRFGPVQGDAR